MKDRTQYGALATVLGIVWGDAMHWFMTPHTEASTGRTIAVGVQLVLALAGFVWAIRRWRRSGVDGEQT